MTPIVIDNSVFLAWCMGDEEDPTATGAMQHVTEEGGVTPPVRRLGAPTAPQFWPRYWLCMRLKFELMPRLN